MARKGKGIVTARQTEALTSLLIDAGLMLGRIAVREIDRRWQQYERRRTKKVMDVIEKALANRVIKDSYSISGIGYLRQEERDAISQAADFLLTEENVHTVIVYGIIVNDNQEELLSGSFRTSKLTIDADTFVKEAFGKSENGDYFGGGKQEAGGFAIPVGFLAGAYGNEYEELKWKMFDLQVKQKIFNKIGVSSSSSLSE